MSGTRFSDEVVTIFVGVVIVTRALFSVHSPSAVDAAVVGTLCCVALLSPQRFSRLGFVVAGGFVFLILHSSLFARDSVTSILTASSFLLFVAAIELGLRLGLKHALVPVVVAGGITFVQSLWQYFIEWPSLVRRSAELGLNPSDIVRLEHGRVVGTTVSPDLNGAMQLAAIAALATVLLHHLPARSPKRWFVVVLSCGLLVVSNVLHRSAGVALAACVFACGVPFFLGSRKRRVGMFVVVMTSAPLVVLTLGRGKDALTLSAHERVINWQIAVDVLMHHPFGVGIGRFREAYAQFRTPMSNETLYAHSFPIQSSVELGVFGIALLAIASVYVVKLVVVAARQKRVYSSSDATVIAAAVALGLRLLFDYDAEVGQTALTTGLILGAACKVLSRRDPPTNVADPPPQGRSVGSLSTANQVASLLGLVTAGFLVVWLSYRETVLEPFVGERIADDNDVDALFSFGETFPRDTFVTTVIIGERVAAATLCVSSCDVIRDELSREIQLVAAAENASGRALAFAARGTLFLAGSVDEAETLAKRAIAREPGGFDGWATRLAVDAARDVDLHATFDEAARWLPPSEIATLKTLYRLDANDAM